MRSRNQAKEAGSDRTTEPKYEIQRVVMRTNMDNPGRGRKAVDDASSEEMTAQLRARGYTIVTPAGTPRYGRVPEPSSGVRWVSTEARTKRHDDRSRSSDERQREEDHHRALEASEERGLTELADRPKTAFL